MEELGICSFVFGIFNCLYVVFWFWGPESLCDPIWETLCWIIDGDAGEAWRTVLIVVFIIPVTLNLMGVTLGIISLWESWNIFAILGLLVNSFSLALFLRVFVF